MPMTDPRIIDITLDERTILWRNADVEQERRIAIFDLLEDNFFATAIIRRSAMLRPSRLKRWTWPEEPFTMMRRRC
jgi:uncharacterized protein (UPF0262 family)